jgi:hypothetical protein
VKKGVIFWVGWTAVIAAAGVFYFMLVHPKLSENEVKVVRRNLMTARLTEVKDPIGDIKTPSKTIREYGARLAKGEKAKGDEQKVEQLAPESFRKQGVDKRIYNLYPLNNNLKRIPNNSAVAAKRLEDEGLLAERAAFARSFQDMMFAADAAKDFKPPPPAHSDLFRQWVTGRTDGQDKLIDQMVEEKLGKGCMKFQDSRDGEPGTACEWLEDGRCSGYIDDRRDRDLVLKRLLLRRLVLAAVTRASAPVRVATTDKYVLGQKLDTTWEVKQLQVQLIDELRFLDGDPKGRDPQRSFAMARALRFGHGGIKPPQPEDNPVPYRSSGFLLRFRCHAGVVPAVISQIERIGEVEHRPFCCWVERVVIGRPGGRTPDWRPDQPIKEKEDLGREDGNRYAEWPVSVEVLVVVPEFDDKLDPLPEVK